MINFGNIVAGTKVTKSFKIRNIGSSSLTYFCDNKLVKKFGIIVKNYKMKLPFKNDNETEIQIIFTTKRSMKSGNINYKIPITIDNGPKYIIEMKANIIGKSAVILLIFQFLNLKFHKMNSILI